MNTRAGKPNYPADCCASLLHTFSAGRLVGVALEFAMLGLRRNFAILLALAFFATLPAHAVKPTCEHGKIAGQKAPKAPKGPKEVVITKVALPLRGGPVKQVDLEVWARNDAERRFKAEEKLYEDARDEDLVPIELMYHPHYIPWGHTSLRIGTSSYEKGLQGWRAHESGGDSARAFLFNNPFFKAQLEKFPDQVAPMSLGATLMVTKKAAREIREKARALSEAEGDERDKFCFMTSNCNQGVLEILHDAGVSGIERPSGYHGFSSVLSFRELLVKAKGHPTRFSIYQMHGSTLTPDELRDAIPPQLHRYNNPIKELFRAVPTMIRQKVLGHGPRNGRETPPPAPPAQNPN